MPNGGAAEAIPTSAVTFIGIGRAGCRILRAVERLTADVSFTYIAMDTNRSDLRANAPDAAHKIALELPWSSLRTDSEEYDYLSDDIQSPGDTAAGRDRRIGRYSIDNENNFDSVYRDLESTIEETHRKGTIDGTDGAHQIWILHSFGGGTGSGAAPLVGVMVDDITTKLPGIVAIGGIGSLPRLDALEETWTTPGNLPRYYVNSYTTLRELSKLIDGEELSSHHGRLNVESGEASDVMAADEFRVSDPPFDVYGLIGISDLERGSYRRLANEFAAGTLMSFASRGIRPDEQTTGLGRYEVVPRHFDGFVLFSIDGGVVRTPLEKLVEYQEVRRHIRETRDEIDRLEDRVDHDQEAIEFLRAVVQYEHNDDPPSEIDDHITQVRDVIDGLHPLETTTEGDLDCVTLGLADRIEGPDLVDSEPVARNLLTTELGPEISDRLSDHSFPGAVTEAVLQHRDDMEEANVWIPEDISETSPIGYWEDVLEPFITGRHDTLQRTIEDLSIFSVFDIVSKRRLESELEEISSRYEDLTSLYQQYHRLTELADRATNIQRESRETLRERDLELDMRLSDTKATIDDLQEDLENLEQEREVRVRALSENRITPHSIELGIDKSVIEMGECSVDNTDDIPTLVNRALLEEKEVMDAIETVASSLREPIQDRSINTPEIPDSDEYLVVQAAPGNERYVQIALDVNSMLHLDTSDPSTILFTKLFAPIDLERTSEFGTIHEWFVDESRDVSEQLGDAVTDATIEAAFAYPELIDRGS